MHLSYHTIIPVDGNNSTPPWGKQLWRNEGVCCNLQFSYPETWSLESRVPVVVLRNRMWPCCSLEAWQKVDVLTAEHIPSPWPERIISKVVAFKTLFKDSHDGGPENPIQRWAFRNKVNHIDQRCDEFLAQVAEINMSVIVAMHHCQYFPLRL